MKILLSMQEKKSHLIASIREAGKVNMLAKGDCHDFLGVLIDGMGK